MLSQAVENSNAITFSDLNEVMPYTMMRSGISAARLPRTKKKKGSPVRGSSFAHPPDIPLDPDE